MAAAKRLRVAPSSSSDDMSSAQSIDSSEQERNITSFPSIGIETTLKENNNNNSGPSIFSISSPVRVHDDDRSWVQFGSFLEKCMHCNNKLCHTVPIFMYRDFGAYCTEECRMKQIELDEVSLLKNLLKKKRP